MGPAPPAKEEEIRLNADGGRGVLYRPVGPGPFPALLLIHGDHGLDEWTREQAKMLAERGYVVLAVDLYRGEKVSDDLDAHVMERCLPDERVLADLKAAVDYLDEHDDVRDDAIGVIGWDIGGGYALDAAIHDDRLAAVVVCYGRLTTDPDLLAPLQASVLGIFGGKDAGIPPETIDQFRNAMQKAGKELSDIHVYPSCGHGFMETADPATEDAWKKITAYLDEELGEE